MQIHSDRLKTPLYFVENGVTHPIPVGVPDRNLNKIIKVPSNDLDPYGDRKDTLDRAMPSTLV